MFQSTLLRKFIIAVTVPAVGLQPLPLVAGSGNTPYERSGSERVDEAGDSPQRQTREDLKERKKRLKRQIEAEKEGKAPTRRQPRQRAAAQDQEENSARSDKSRKQARAKSQQNLKKKKHKQDHFKQYSQAHKKMRSFPFHVSPKSGSLSTSYIADKVNGLWGAGRALKVAMSYKKGQHSPYLPVKRKNCHKTKLKGVEVKDWVCKSLANWSLSFPAIYQTPSLHPTRPPRPVSDYHHNWVLQLHGSTHTFSTLPGNHKAKPVTSSDFYNDSDMDQLSLFQYSHLAGNGYTRDNSEGNKFPGANIEITKVVNFDEDDGEVEFHTADNIQYELKRQPNIDIVHQKDSGDLYKTNPQEPFLLQEMRIPLDKPIKINDRVMRSQVYHFDYKSVGKKHYAIVITSWGEPAHYSDREDPIHKTRVAVLDINMNPENYYGKLYVNIATPNYNGRNDHGGLAPVGSPWRYAFESGANSSNMTFNDRGNITKIETPDEREVNYNYREFTTADGGSKTVAQAIDTITKPNKKIVIDYRQIGNYIFYTEPSRLGSGPQGKPSSSSRSIKARPVHQVTYKVWPGRSRSSFDGGRYKQVTYNFCAVSSGDEQCNHYSGKIADPTPTTGNTFLFPFGMLDGKTYHASLGPQMNDKGIITKHGSYWLDALFRYGTMSFQIQNAGESSANNTYWSTAMRHEIIMNQYYGTLVETNYFKGASDKANLIKEYYKYDATGRKVHYSRRTYPADGDEAIGETIHNFDYAIALNDIGVTSGYSTYADLPLYWRKPHKKLTEVYKEGSALAGGKLVKQWNKHYHYTDLGQLKWTETRDANDNFISGVYKRYACKLYGNQTRPDVIGTLHFNKHQSRVAYRVNHYWRPDEASAFELGDGYPDTVLTRIEHGLVNHGIDTNSVNAMKTYSGMYHCDQDNSKPDNSIVTKITGHNIQTNDDDNDYLSGDTWPAIVGHYTKAPDNLKPLMNFSDEITRSSQQVVREVVTNDKTDQHAWLKLTTTRQGKGDYDQNSASHQHYVNQYGLLRKKVKPTGVTESFTYDFMGRRLSHQVQDHVRQKYAYDYNRHNQTDARVVKVYNPVHNHLTRKSYNPLGKLTVVKQGKPRENQPFEFSHPSFFTSAHRYNQAILRDKSIHYKHGKKDTSTVGTRYQYPIRDHGLSRIGTYNPGKGLSHVHYKVNTGGEESAQGSNVKVSFAFDYDKKSGYQLYGGVKLVYRDKYTGRKRKVEHYRAKKLRPYINLGSQFFKEDEVAALRSAENDPKTTLLNEIKDAGVPPYKRMRYTYTESDDTNTSIPIGLLDQIKLSYPAAADKPVVTKAEHTYDKYGQLKHVTNMHGIKHASVKNLLGQAVYHKMTPSDGDTYYLGQVAHNTLGRKIYADQRPGPSELNEWDDDNSGTYSETAYDDSGRMTTHKRANGTALTYKYNNDTYPGSVTGVNLDGDKWKRITYDDYNFKTKVKQFNPDGSQVTKNIHYNDRHLPHKIDHSLHNIAGLDFNWQTVHHYNDLNQSYKVDKQFDGKSYTIGGHTYTDEGRVSGYNINPPGADASSQPIHLSMCYDNTGHLAYVHALQKARGILSARAYDYNANLQLSKTTNSLFVNGNNHKPDIALKVVSEIDRYSSGYPSQLTNTFQKVALSGWNKSIHGLPDPNVFTNTYHYTYNQDRYNGIAGHLTQRKASNQRNETFEYDALGNITQHTYGNGKPYKYEYTQPFTLYTITRGDEQNNLLTTKRGRVAELERGKKLVYTPLAKIRKITLPVGQGGTTIRYFYGWNGKPVAKQVGNKLAVRIAGGWSAPIAPDNKEGAEAFYDRLNWSLPHSLGTIRSLNKNGIASYLSGNIKTFNDNIVIGGARGGSQEQYYYYRYTAFGKQLDATPNAGDVATYPGFKTQATDPTTGWQYLGGNRLYAPAIGRFLQPDSQSPGPGGLNPYRFARNNPILFADHSGHSFWDDIEDTIDDAEDAVDDAVDAAEDAAHALKHADKVAANAIVHNPVSNYIKDHPVEVGVMAGTIAFSIATAGAGAALAPAEVGAEVGTEVAVEETAEMATEETAEMATEETTEMATEETTEMATEETTEMATSSAGRQLGRKIGSKTFNYLSDTSNNFVSGHIASGGGGLSKDEALKNLAFSGATAGFGMGTTLLKDAEKMDKFDKYAADTIGNAGLFSVKAHVSFDSGWHGSAMSFGKTYATNIFNIGGMQIGGHLLGKAGARLGRKYLGSNYGKRFGADAVEKYGVGQGYGAYFGASLPTAPHPYK